MSEMKRKDSKISMHGGSVVKQTFRQSVMSEKRIRKFQSTAAATLIPISNSFQIHVRVL
jgi:hypothetical protein